MSGSEAKEWYSLRKANAIRKLSVWLTWYFSELLGALNKPSCGVLHQYSRNAEVSHHDSQ
jgi:hypothetical protein